MRQEDPRVTLAHSPVIAVLPAEIREEFVGKCRVRVYAPRERICAIGDPVIGPTWYERGLLKACGQDDQGEEVSAGWFWSGDISLVGFPTLKEWPAELTAVAPTTVVAIPEAIFAEFCDRSVDISLAWLALVADHLRNRHRREAILRSLTLRPRLIALLRTASNLLGTPTPEGILLDFPLTHTSLACGAWVSPDETGRAMRDLEAQGYFRSLPRHRILIPDCERLEHYQPKDAEELSAAG